jgi:hypothetical protein
MADAFLKVLGEQINSQFSLGENVTHTLDAVIDGKNVKYGALGDLASKIDQSATRSYVEEGFLRNTPYQANPKQLAILLQEPSATILVKKRMFSSLAENHRPDYMDADEKLFYRASKVLFQNKCRQISALEKLSKIQQVTSAVGNVSEQLIPVISTLTDTITQSNAGGTNIAGFGTLNSNTQVSNFVKVIDRVRKLHGFNTTNQTTTWITDSTNLFQSSFGQGTGVIEITNFNSFSTTVGLGLNAGNFQFTIMDPYESMRISEFDIERALSDATNVFYNHKFFQFGKETADQLIVNLQNRLNQYRSERGASPLSFKINPDTLLGKRLTVIIDRTGTELIFSGGSVLSDAQVAPEYLKGGAVAGLDGLDTINKTFRYIDSDTTHRGPDSELSLFQRLVTTIFDKISLEANSRNAIIANNKNTNYARRKMRFSFLGKLIIQPMDVVHIYVNSKSRYDTKLMSGIPNMFGGAGVLQNLNKTVVDTKNAIDTMGTFFGGSGGVNLQVEKSAFVGPNFPNFLWALLRGQFVTEKEGTHIFAGIVDGANSNWSDGKFQIDVRGSDNTAYFNFGKVNFKPSVDVFNGALFDPLTPFKTKFDTIGSVTKSDDRKLLDENVQLLGTTQDNDSPLVKFKLGPNAGRRAASDNLLQDHSIDKVTGRVNKIYHAPDGLVYKWKEGIGTLVMFGSSQEMEDPNLLGTPAITNEPFAGQDVMNVLSLLITGQPYNFATYWKAIVNWDAGYRDPQSGQDAAYSFYAALRSDLSKNNALWGNFVPFKNLVMDEQTYALTQAQLNIIRNNKDLESKIQRLAELRKKSLVFGAEVSNVLAGENQAFQKAEQDIQSQIQQLTKEVDTLVAAEQEDRKKFAGLVQFGSDTSFDFNEFVDSSKASRQASKPGLRRLLRRQLNHLTRRMSYNVRANEDKNLFIVDDSYDKDYDIIAFETTLDNGIKLYNNEFTSIREKIALAAGLLDLEVFCDTQGHIRVRSPQYNRMPSSIFYRMMYLKRTNGVQVFPQFLEDLFSNQIQGLIRRVEVLEDQIRLDCAVLGINDDQSAVSFILSGGSNQGDGSTFAFLTDESSGKVVHLSDLFKAANPDQGEASLSSKGLKDLASKIGPQATTTKDIFNTTQRINAILTALGARTANKLSQSGYSVTDVPAFNNNTYIDTLINRIRDASGQEIQRTSYLDPGSPGAKPVVDAFKTIQELADKIKDRQGAVKILYGALKNAAEFKSLDDDSSLGSALLLQGNFGNSHIPEVFEHMIEDESYDDYGPGSGSRYIIRNSQIRNLNIGENPPDFTLVSVQGKLDPLISNNSLPSDLNVFPQSGNGLVTGMAIDYDMWRNYGFRELNPINVPFLNDPNTQCAPYAAMILSRARRNIIRGSVTISGNEYMQPGEVVFLEDRAMLFYVSSVRHSFTYSSGFTTTLDLTYGHAPGEYIPTPLDVVGKMLYNNRDLNDAIIQRQSSAFNESNLGVLLKDKRNTSNDIFSTNNLISDGNADQQTNTYSSFNSATINNILNTAAYRINANNSKGNTVKASVELRVYYDKKHPINNDIVLFAKKVKNILTSSEAGPKQLFKNTTGVSTNPHLKPENVSVIQVNLDEKDDPRSPSQKAFDAARNNLSNISVSDKGDPQPGSSELIQSSNLTVTIPTEPKDKLRVALFNYVVDCWIKFDQVSTAQANSSG